MTTNGNWVAPGKEQPGKGAALAETPTGKRPRGLLCLCLCFCLTLGLLPSSARALDFTGTWLDTGNYDTSWYSSSGSDFTITTAEELAGLSYLAKEGNDFSGKTIHLGADIDLSAHYWIPIGYIGYSYFTGEFDGGGKTVRGVEVVPSPEESYAGFFRELRNGSKVHDLQITDASVSVARSMVDVGILAGICNGEIYNCSVSGSVSATNTEEGCESNLYAGGLVGASSGGIIKNCSAQIKSITVNNMISNSGYSDYVGGILAEVSDATVVENCFASVDKVISLSPNTGTKEFRVAPKASYCYWDNDTALSDSGNSVYVQCCPVTAEQMAGTGSTVIGADSTHANTPSLAAALNNWVAASSDSKYSQWSLANGKPMLSVFPAPPAPPDYIDITTVPDQTKEGTAGQVNADVKLEGQVQENVELISVTLPASIPFIMDVDAAGALNRVLSATATLTNRSDVGVTVTLTDVVDNDPTPLLDKADFVLVPDPDPTGNPVSLTAGTGKTDVLAILAAPADGVPTTSLLKVDGAAKADVASVGSDGDSFTIGLTLKVNKTT